VSINGVTYTKAESGIVITATRTSGDTLTAGDSTAFTVNPGTATSLAFITQPGNATAGTAIPGPPTLAVRDAFGNTVTSSTAAITIAIGSNPGSGALSGTTSKNAVSGIASFNDLSINSSGNGYTLTAAATGLSGATSNAFNITAAGGTISGTVTRVSDGSAVAGAVVEAFLGTVLQGSASTGGSGSYTINGLADGVYTVRASASGFVPQIREGVTVASSGSVTVNLSLNAGIAIHSPVAAAVINDHEVLVTGQFDTSLGSPVGININGFVALQDGDEFAAVVPVDSQTTSLIATVTNTTGTALASHTISVTVQPPASQPISAFRPTPPIALVSQPVSFILDSLNPVSQVQLDANGDGTIDFTGSTLAGQPFTFSAPGLYFPEVTVTEMGGAVRTATTVLQVLDDNDMDAFLQSKWQAMKDALRQGNITLALTHIVARRRSIYQGMFNASTVPLSNIDQVLTNITLVQLRGIEAEYTMTAIDGGFQYSYLVLFALDEDGIWRIKFF